MADPAADAETDAAPDLMGLFSDRRRLVLSEPAVGEDGRLRIKVWMLGGFALLLFGILTVQLVRLQIFRQSEFETRATINRLRVADTPAERGLIFDRNGNPLVENVPAFAITIIPADVPAGGERAVALKLSQLLNLPPFEIEARILERKRSNDPFLPIVLDGDADSELAFTVSELRGDLPGVQVETVAKRRYAEGELLAHILGYIGPISEEEFEELQADRYRIADRIGQTGVEAVYEALLRGVPGRRQTEVNASGRELRVLSDERPTPGQGIVLTLDLELQAAVTEILQNSLGGSIFGSAVVVDVRTGEILAMVSLPTYDNNLFSGEVDEADLAAILEDEGRPLVNHAIADQFPPGSIFKVITGSAALQEGVITPDERIFSPGVIEVQNEVDPRVTYTFQDTTSGTFNFVKGLAESSNVYFWFLSGGSPFRRPIAEELLTPAQREQQQRLVTAGIIGEGQEFEGLGAERLADWSRAFGLDARTGIDLAGEASGFIPDPGWKLRTFGESWGQGDSYNFGIGQGFVAVTPLQMALVTAAIANGGTVFEPRVVRELLDQDGNVVAPFRPQVKRELDIDPQNLELVRRGMAMAVLGGTAGNAYFPEMQIGGKTGTAEFGDQRLFRGDFPTHGWFLGFAPFDEPRIAIAVFHELGAGYLTATAGGEIMKAWAELSGAIDENTPALPQLAFRDDDEFYRLESRLP
ncbi:MAG: penicillin-binding protein 2 [Dehalococcoidia bacterium]